MKNIFYIALILLFLSVIKKKKMDSEKLKFLLLENGFPKETINFFVAQAMFESNFNSHVALENKNLTGIIFINKPYQKNASKGLKMPTADGNGFYAKFDSLNDWAKDYKRILSLDKGNGKPIEAKNLIDFVSRLKTNYYFGGNQNDYLAGVTKKHSTLV